MAAINTSPRIGVALGSGAARGLAHIPYIETMDALGVKPSIIAGTSIGALLGAGWANGMTGKELREHAYSVLSDMQLIAGKLWTSHRPTLEKLLQSGISMQVDAQNITNAFLPEDFPKEFSDLEIPFDVVSTDFHAWDQTVFSSGLIRPAIAASIAIPGVFKPVTIGSQLHIDGGVTNPLPLDRAAAKADILIGIDVNGLPDKRLTTISPNMLDVGFVATQIMAQTIIKDMIRLHPPTIYVQPSINSFSPLEFWRVKEIITEVEKDQDRFKKVLSEKIETFEQNLDTG